MSIPRIIAHRGSMATEPENTLRSFLRAEADDADEIELDLRLSADGEVVVIHDGTVDRTTDGSGRVDAMSLAELRGLDAGLGERIPTIREVLTTVRLPIQAEVKDAAALEPFARIVAELGVAERIVLSAASADTLRVAARVVPELPRALILGKTPDDLVAQAGAVGAAWLAPGITRLTPDHVAECAAAGISVDAWPANSEEQLRQCMALGVQAVTADDPAAVRRWAAGIARLTPA
ncbi:glycerophosphodiester phosphodiesterase [Rugosimonospora africana]|uniref:Glycerophosphoryl diester phosphodiesterase n=1 Tax=Rugosimonospora africana TaxID=556532 RepID=A0A8J3QT92_9ACTN|nr:glycerophosphodiester phosphodiesterase family protein [Rugosimonospora africana]GIH15782.1 glycerophosphoryl diester phosphodiesterase [Rugosimonospora africana]